MAVEGTNHANEITFKDAIKNMATKDNIDAVVAKLESRIAWRLVITFGISVAIISFIKAL